ncbi:MAG: hypothetical protein A2Z96_05415 [Spirochaetes bacterium GWB1_48_6]|nr:MAG: hypothetical protein A2Z96_05415 [Spirochaetes bacterium GWB1_48_6]
MNLRSIPFVLTHARLLLALEKARIELRNQGPVLEFNRMQAEKVGRILGINPGRAYALIEQKIYKQWFKLFTKVKPFPGLAETLGRLKTAGLKLAVMSDFPIRNRLRDMGLDGYWTTVFSSEETGALKPRPEAFHRLALELGCEPSKILYVGNSYRYDILGAKRAGFLAAHLTSRPPSDSLADFSFKNYEELENYIFRCLAKS